MEQNKILETFALCKNYKEHRAVDNVSMTVYEGDIYGFVGENGAGKTTLIRLVCGLIHSSGGEYSLFGISNKNREIEKAKKRMSAIVEGVALNKSLTALDNLKAHCLLSGIKKTDKELNELIKEVGLNPTDISKKKVGSFSLGMRQRIGLAISMVSDPKFILLDEPMNGLDPQGFVDLRETILRLNKKGVTFLISSHILAELDKICNRVGFLSHGHLIEELSMDELHEKARRKIVIKTKNPQELLDLAIKELNIQESKTEGYSVIIYDLIDINDVINFLSKNKIQIENIYSGEETIEDYYREVMGREAQRWLTY